MPNYTYQCTKCEQELEINHSIKDNAIEYQIHINPNGDSCNGKLKRLISNTSFRFKNGAPTPKHYM